MNRMHAWRGPSMMVMLVLVVWQVLYWIVGDVALRSPADTVRHTAALFERPTFWPHVAESMKAFAAAIVLAVSIGLSIGLVLGFRKLAGQVFEPMLVALYSVPKVTLYPILLLTFGLGISAKIAFASATGICSPFITRLRTRMPTRRRCVFIPPSITPWVDCGSITI